MDKKNGFPTVMGIFEDGFGSEFAQTLADAIEQYAKGLEADGLSMSKTDVINIVNLVWLLKAVLKDVHGVEIE